MNIPTFVILIVCFASIALSDDFKTINGKEYKDAIVSRVEPDGIVLKTKLGISKVYFTELPKEVQQRFLPPPPKTVPVHKRMLIGLKSWAAAVENPTSFVLLVIGGASLIAAAAFAIVRGRLQ